MARLSGVQKPIEMNPYNNYLWDFESSLTSELNSILDREKMYWLNRSRVGWLNEGDKNF